MTQKSNWLDVGEDYWSENKSKAFNFDELDDEFAKTLESLGNESSVVISSPVTQSKGSDLKLSESLAKKQIQNCLKHLDIGDKSTSSGSVSTKLTPKEAINCLTKGIDVNLKLYKGKEEKLELLDRAVDSNDGNVIIQAVLHLNQTIKPSVFNYELSKRSLAANHYIFYLKQNQRTNDLMDVLSMLGRHEEVAITAYNQAISCANIETKIQLLKSCLRNHFTSGGNDVLFWSTYISEQISLLEHQLPIEADDKRQERDGINPVFGRITRIPLIDSSVITTLLYCCSFHYSLPENHLASPKAMVKTYHLNQKQFVWTALSALAKCQLWPEIDALFEYKSWLGNKRMKSYIPFDRVVSVLHKNEAPQELTQKYLQLIDDIEVMLKSAKDVKLMTPLIDTLIKQKDRKKLEEVMQKMDKKSEEFVYLQNTISSFNWKN